MNYLMSCIVGSLKCLCTGVWLRDQAEVKVSSMFSVWLKELKGKRQKVGNKKATKRIQENKNGRQTIKKNCGTNQEH